MSDTATVRKVYRMVQDGSCNSRSYWLWEGWLLDLPDRRLVVATNDQHSPRYFVTGDNIADWCDSPEAARAAIVGEIRARYEREVAAVGG